jgi:hypothetical protein
MRVARTFALSLVLALFVGGCALFAPAYDETLDQKSTSAYENVVKLLARVELGAFTDPDSYAEAEEDYATVLAELAVARLRADTLPVSNHGTAAEARSLLSTFIQNCATQVQELAAIHRSSGVQPQSGITQPIQVTCDQAARAARALQ